MKPTQDEMTAGEATPAQGRGDVLMRVEAAGKRFCRSLRLSLWYGVLDVLSELVRSKKKRDLRRDEFWAVKDVSFELRRGECLGLIGHNGAGKTTLLKMLNGLIKPDRGRIEIRGRVGALIALGAGFNPVLTGRENVYVNASLLGLTRRQVDQKIDEIVDFAELREFIDSPVQNYSSGMTVRLGFAVAAILIEPDVLFLDEVLAVGDIGFTIKCLNAVRRLSQHSAVVFVSHNMQFISAFCSRVIVMDHGECVLDSTDIGHGIDHYHSMVGLESHVSGSGEAEIFDVCLKGEAAASGPETMIRQGEEGMLSLGLRIHSGEGQLHIYIMDEAMVPVMYVPVQGADGQMTALPAGAFHMEIPLGRLELSAGRYSVVAGVEDVRSRISKVRAQGLAPFQVTAVRMSWGKIMRPANAKISSLSVQGSNS